MLVWPQRHAHTHAHVVPHSTLELLVSLRHSCWVDVRACVRRDVGAAPDLLERRVGVWALAGGQVEAASHGHITSAQHVGGLSAVRFCACWWRSRRLPGGGDQSYSKKVPSCVGVLARP